MTTVAILPENSQIGGTAYRAVAGPIQSVGKTAGEALDGLTAQLRDEVDLEALAGDLVGVVQETMQPAYASLWLRETSAAPTPAVEGAGAAAVPGISRSGS